ncbi:MAG: hypothetical protein LIP00_00595 [Parabacteroides sp.]|nr:hypothetical protein [Parabacteroides sp.]
MKHSPVNLLLLCICLLSGIGSSSVVAQVSEPLSFLTPFTPLSARITDYAYKDTVPAPAALIRLPNKKIAYMVRRNGKLVPFYVKAIETGYWDTCYEKDTDYDRVFRDMKSMGANTASIMIHWGDIEPADNRFDFTFTDSLVKVARRHEMKINWVLFLHAVPARDSAMTWTFHLDDRDTSCYTLQWVKRKGVLYTSLESIAQYVIRPLHVYGHPEIFYRIRRMLYTLGLHYRNDETVIGVQIGNEEGFSFLDESDYNPVTARLFEEWKVKTNKSDYAQFKKEAMNWWWQQFTSAYHEGDPYKIVSFNLDAAQAEAGDKGRMEMTGTDAGTYADGNVDVIGTMFYQYWGDKALAGLDRRYGNSYLYRLPLLVPSEIGIGVFNPSALFRRFVIHTLERGGQGFGVYCYGEIRNDRPDKATERKAYIDLIQMINANEEMIYEGLPGPGEVSLSCGNPEIKISQLHTLEKGAVAFVYFPAGADTIPVKVDICATSVQKKTYRITVYREGKCVSEMQKNLGATPSAIFISDLKKDEIVFIGIR